jgi:hypothetical protein
VLTAGVCLKSTLSGPSRLCTRCVRGLSTLATAQCKVAFVAAHFSKSGPNSTISTSNTSCPCIAAAKAVQTMTQNFMDLPLAAYGAKIRQVAAGFVEPAGANGVTFADCRTAAPGRPKGGRPPRPTFKGFSIRDGRIQCNKTPYADRSASPAFSPLAASSSPTRSSKPHRRLPEALPCPRPPRRLQRLPTIFHIGSQRMLNGRR